MKTKLGAKKIYNGFEKVLVEYKCWISAVGIYLQAYKYWDIRIMLLFG